MYFCKECGTSLDVSKISSGSKNEKSTVKKKKISTITSLIQKIIEEDLPLENFIIDMDIEELQKNTKFKKLSQTQKDNVIGHITDQTKDDVVINGNANFFCDGCNFSEPITSTLLLLVDDNSNVVSSLKPNDYHLYINDKTLYRTHNYNCKNVSCETNNNKYKGNKEAVVVKHSKSFRPTYICVVCNYGWTL
jgi:hypothetical protein